MPLDMHGMHDVRALQNASVDLTAMNASTRIRCMHDTVSASAQ